MGPWGCTGQQADWTWFRLWLSTSTMRLCVGPRGMQAQIQCSTPARPDALRLEGERKMGEMLAATERASGAKGVGPSIVVTGGNRNAPPTLAALGLTKRDSAEAQRLRPWKRIGGQP
jgi:hypothetical protein